MIEIQNITAREAIAVRHPVLRNGKPIESCHFSGDDLGTTYHLGAFEKDLLIGVATFLMNKDITIKEIKDIKLFYCYQLRGMAVIEKAQKKGIGKKILLHAEDMLRQQEIKILWFNARTTAVPFYEQLNYKVISDVFDVPGVGPHFKMMKFL
jgi:GNAT superfamily N-acetyltransferase